MHKLERSSVTPPDCLADYDYPQHTWGDLNAQCRSQLRAALVKMQSAPETTEDAKTYPARCAYCECAIFHGGHIEHFRRKNPKHFPELTFAWTNLFLSCDSKDFCGHYKDSKSASPYDPDDLIKPDKDDPDKYLYFHSTGEVRVREGLNEKDQHRASETIRVLGLDNTKLRGKRAKAVSAYRKEILNDLNTVASWSPEEIIEYLQGEIDETRWEPYSTTIKHFLQTQT